MGVVHGQEVDPRQINDPEFHGCEKASFRDARGGPEGRCRGADAQGAPAIYVYQCQYCGGWHLTHRKPRS